jgi:hypothetical protein
MSRKARWLADMRTVSSQRFLLAPEGEGCVSGTTIAFGGFGKAPSLTLRWSLIRNQIAIARRRERTFAIQLWVRLSFMGWFVGEEDFGNFFAELLFG